MSLIYIFFLILVPFAVIGELIYDCNSLQNISQNTSGSYMLNQSFSCSFNNFTPIQDFSGSLDGMGFTISNVFVNVSHSTYAGMFGKCTGAVLRNLVIRNATFNAYQCQYVALIFGYCSGCTIQNVTITADFPFLNTINLPSSAGYGAVGTLTGCSQSTNISNCIVENTIVNGSSDAV